MNNQYIKTLSDQLHEMKNELHDNWKACPNSLTTRNQINKINELRRKIIKLQDVK